MLSQIPKLQILACPPLPLADHAGTRIAVLTILRDDESKLEHLLPVVERFSPPIIDQLGQHARLFLEVVLRKYKVVLFVIQRVCEVQSIFEGGGLR